MRIGTWRVRDAELGCAVAKDEIALRSVQKNHGARQQELLGQPFHGGLKCDRVDRLESWRGRAHGTAG